MNFSIGKKLYSGFIAVLVILVIVGVIGYLAAIKIDKEYTFLLDDRVKKIEMVNEVITIEKDMSINSLAYFAFSEQRDLDAIKSKQEEFANILSELKQATKQSKTKEILNELEEAGARYNELTSKVFESQEKGLEAETNKYVTETNEAEEALKDKALELKQVQMEEVNETRTELKRYVVATKIFLILLVAAGTILGGVIAYFIARSITRPVRKVTAALKEVTAGNLQVDKLRIRNKDEVGEMGMAFNQLVEDLQNILGKVNQSALQLSAQSQELSASTEQSAASSQMMASTAEENMKGSSMQRELISEAVVSMEEMSEGIKQIAESNENMLHSAEVVESLVGQGEEATEHVSDQIEDIHVSIKETEEYMKILENHASEIQKVTGLITAISEQTNLLALNAAIEAARAGEAGKGFAVVAEEVRKLAEQSKTSAAEIAAMVKEIQKDTSLAAASIQAGSNKVEQGLSASQTSLKVFKEIKSSVTDVGEKVETVSAAIEELEAMTEAVSQSAHQVRAIAEKTATIAHDSSAATEEQLAAIEQIATSSQALASLATELQTEASKFRM
ncbi:MULTISPECIES: HAMP domain-containing methyl-accepting chemotaxis protein [Bacillaceae]|uniref:methyl-accepting chemotaxis protein n=1 Tax=Bacillaceae TaxID=186817 RepID=UPI00115CAFF2|nr:HAMP domain-containing methyl-accepting chemotaxis protein [Bacillus sp. PK3_68]